MSLRRAQAAVLCPNINADGFLTKSVTDLREMALSFSNNVVCIDISGPDLTNLDFVDLPGLIQNADSQTVSFIEDIVRSHIKGNCLILMTLPMSDDIENQKVVRLAKEADPEDEDERARGATLKEARDTEASFFATTTLWSGSSHLECFGTDKLVASLNRLLAEMIDRSLPTLDEEAAQQMSQCFERFSRLPPAVTSDASTYVLNMITKLVHDCQMLIQGASDPSLVQTNRKTYETYRRDILMTAPFFLPIPTQDGREYAPQDLELDEDGAVEHLNSQPMTLKDVRQHVESSITRELPHNVPYSAKVSLIQKYQADWRTFTDKCFNSVCASFERSLVSLIGYQLERFETLRASVLRHVRDLLHHQAELSSQHLTTLLRFESSLYTQHSHDLRILKDKYLAKYKDFKMRACKAADPYESALPHLNTSDSAHILSTQSLQATPPEAFTSADQSLSTPSPAIPSDNSSSSSASSWVAQPEFGFGNGTESTPVPTPAASVRKPVRKKKGTRPAAGANSQADGTFPRASSPAAETSPFGVFGGAGSFSALPREFLKETGPGFACSATSSAQQVGSTNLMTFPQNHSPWASLRPDTSASASQPSLVQVEPSHEETETELLAALARLGLGHVTLADLSKLTSADTYETKIELMAEVRVYFSISYKRITDYVPLSIDHTYLHAVTTALQSILVSNLHLATEKMCEMYLAETPVLPRKGMSWRVG
ncbi:hypothetical protein EUX98_g6029 [Antrodiella citrinella]|uniref:GED domain-containing protein n=1 Tax=Antrodiella citrinella TaxID=2447956 RepID=A0A4S4MS65_9APHY|nr:hypothetical protein EUX98_g6029 [Antrodiella citrinella]